MRGYKQFTLHEYHLKIVQKYPKIAKKIAPKYLGYLRKSFHGVSIVRDFKYRPSRLECPQSMRRVAIRNLFPISGFVLASTAGKVCCRNKFKPVAKYTPQLIYIYCYTYRYTWIHFLLTEGILISKIDI